MLTSWKMTISGLVTGAAGLILAMSQAGVQEPKWLTITAAFVLAGGFAALGINGKDSNVTGGTIDNQTRPK